MADTKQVPREQLQAYFETFTKRFLRDDSPEAADVEVMSTAFGHQSVTSGARLIGITYEPPTNSLEIAIELGGGKPADHRVLKPTEVWVVEGADGFVQNIEAVDPEGTRDLITIRKVGQKHAG